MAQQFGFESVVRNNAILNEQNKPVINVASNSIFSGLQKMVLESGIGQLTELFQVNNSSDNLSLVVQKFTEEFTGNLETKFGVNIETASNVATSLIPKILGSLVKKAKYPNDNSLQISDTTNAIYGRCSQNLNIKDALSKYGGRFGLN